MYCSITISTSFLLYTSHRNKNNFYKHPWWFLRTKVGWTCFHRWNFVLPHMIHCILLTLLQTNLLTEIFCHWGITCSCNWWGSVVSMCIDVSASGLFFQVSKQGRVGADLILQEDYYNCGKKGKERVNWVDVQRALRQLANTIIQLLATARIYIFVVATWVSADHLR